MLLGDQHRDRLDLVGEAQRRLVEAEQEIRARLAAAQQLVGVGRVDAHLVALLLQRADGLLQMRERRVGQAAEIDHVGALLHIVGGALQDRLDGKRGRIDDLGEDLDVVFGHVGGFARAAEENGDVLELVRPAQEGHAEALAETVEIGTAAAGQQDLGGLDRLRQPPRDDVLGHQRGDLHADIQHLPVEAGIHAAEHGLEPRPRQMSGQEQDAFRHVRSLLARQSSSPPFAPRHSRESGNPVITGLRYQTAEITGLPGQAGQ